MRGVGIDLALRAPHRATVFDDAVQIGKPFKVRPTKAGLDELVRRATAGAEGPCEFIMEPTGLAYLPVAAELQSVSINGVVQPIRQEGREVTLPVVPGANRIQVFARASDGSIGRDTITIHYQPGGQRSLDLEVFLEREKSLQLEVQRLGKSDQQIQEQIDRDRENSLRRSQQPPPTTEGPPR